MRDVSEKELGEKSLTKVKAWFNEDFVQQNIVKLVDNPHHPLKRFKADDIIDVGLENGLSSVKEG